MSWVPHGLRDGVVTSSWPRRPDAYFESLPAAVGVRDDAAVDDDVLRAAEACPTSAITTVGGRVRLDRGRCILCGRCAAIAPDTFQPEPGARVAALRRADLVVPVPHETAAAVAEVRRLLALRVRGLRRSVHIRHVDTGSDGSEEWEIQALTNPVYDIHRLGLFFTASPRHADILLVTGIGAPGMSTPLQRVRESMPDPVVVIACGTDAISGGLVAGGYGPSPTVADQLDVDLLIPGSPPSPFSILHGVLAALDRLPAEKGGRG